MTDFTHSLAIVIGIDAYSGGIPRLTTAVNDATRLAELLHDAHGYETILLTGPATGQPVTQERLRTLFTQELPARLGDDDRLLVYFAGHGVALPGDTGPAGYLVPQDARLGDSASMLAMTDLHARLTALPCRHMLAILDCCFAGAFRWASTRQLGALPDVIHKERYDRYLLSPAWQVLTSAAYDQTALDVLAGDAKRGSLAGDGGPHSPFALALIAALEQGAADLVPKGQGDGVITATELYLYLREQVEVQAEEQASHEQTPGLWPLNKHRKGEFIFLVPGHPLNLPPAPPLTADDKTKPYRGLQSYDQDHRPFFFGREQEIEELTALVSQQPFVAVLGASGTGKSSLVKAGVLPRLEESEDASARGSVAEDRQEEATEQVYHVVPPIRPTDQPVQELETRLRAALGDAPWGFANPHGLDGDDALAQIIARWAAANPGKRLVLTIDQFEELATLCRNDAERARFLRLLAAAVEQQPNDFRLLITLRTDFEPQFTQEGAPLAGIWQVGRYIVPPMGIEDLRQVIEGPASVSVLTFDPPELVDDLIKEVIQTPGALPLLSFTLNEMYMRYLKRQEQAQQQGEVIERSLIGADYQALGGVVGSLRNRATEEYERLPDDAHRATMQRVMLRMVSVEGGELARRRVALSELAYPTAEENARVQTVLDRLVDARLLVRDSTNLDADGNPDPYVEPAHDALVLAWDKLLRWKKEAEEYLPLQRRLAQAAGEWSKANPEAKSGLLWDDDPRLPQVEEALWPTGGKQKGLAGRVRWMVQVLAPKTEVPADTKWLNEAELTFVRTSVQRRAAALRRIIGIGLAVIIVVGALVSFGLYTQRQSALNAQTAATEKGLKEIALVARATAVAAQAETERLKRGIQADQLTVNALKVVDESPPLALLLAVEGMRTQNDFTTTVVLAEPVTPQTTTPITHSAMVNETVAGSAVTNVYELLDRTGGIPLAGHEGDVVSVAFSPDGRWLATASGDKTARLWDMADLTAAPRILADHEAAVLSVAFSPDGRWLATASSDKTARLWDATDPGAASRTLRGHEDTVRFVAFSPDGRWLATASDDQTARLWDMADPAAAPRILAGHEGVIWAVAFSPDGRWLATASDDATARLWDLADPAATPRILAGHENRIKAVAFSPDGRWLATASGNPYLGPSDNTVRLWDMADPGAAPRILVGHENAVNAVAFSPDGRWLATASDDDTARLWDMADPAAAPRILTGHVNEVWAVAFSPDGRWLATASWDKTVRLWDTADPRVPSRILVGHEDGVDSVAFSPDGRWLATASWDHTARLWNMANLPAASRILAGHSAEVRDIAFSPDGHWLATASVDATTRLWDLADPAAAPRILAGQQWWVVSVAFSPDGHWLATASFDHTARLWDIADPTAAPRILVGHEDAVNAVAFSPDGRWLATASSDATARLWDMTDPAAPPRILAGHENLINAVAFSPDGRWLATASDDDTARLWELADPAAAPRILTGHADDVVSAAFSPDGRWLATSSWDKTARLWDVADPAAAPRILAGHEDRVNAVAFSPDGRWLATVSDDATARLWDMADPAAAPRILAGHYLAVTSVTFSPDGRWLATASADRTARLWDVANPTAAPRILAGHEDGVVSVAFSPDGRWLATASRDTARLWAWRVDDLIATACRFAGRNLTPEEWQRYLPDSPYRGTCPQWPVHPSVAQGG